ncbi:MAG TPA: mechanosensitive ion channel [Pirellulaceae bacterium]|nr:mechanosensitive ion channel [Pirellulaceae bacterium]
MTTAPADLNGNVVPVELPTVEQVIAEIETVKGDPEVSDEVETGLVAQLTQVQQELVALGRLRETRGRWRAMIDSAPAEGERIASELERLAAPRQPLPTDRARPELEGALTEIGLAIQRATAARDAVAAEPARRQQRLTEIPAEVTGLRDSLGKIELQAAEPPPTGETPRGTRYRRLLLDVRREAANVQLQALDLEQQAYAATSQLLPRQQELADKQLADLQQQRSQIETRLAELLAAAGADQVRTAESTAATTLEELRPLADDVVRLARDHQAELLRLEQLSRDLDRIERERAGVDEDFDYLRKRLETVGLTSGYGALLRSKRNELLVLRSEFDPRRSDQVELRSTQLRIFEVQEERRRMLRDPELREGLIERLILAHPELDPDTIAAETDAVLRRKLDGLAQLESSCQTHFERWVAVDSARHELVRRADEFIVFIEERVLWVRSAEAIRPRDLSAALGDLLRLVDRDRWTVASERAFADPSVDLIFVPAVLILAVALIVYRTRLRRIIAAQGAIASKRSCQAYRPTLVAMGATLITASMWPLLLLLIGWRLRAPVDPTGFLNAVAEGVTHTAYFLWPIDVLRQLTRPDGMAEHHFGWHAESRRMLRRSLHTYGTIAPLLFLITEVFHQLEELATAEQEWQNEAGRVFFLVLLALTTAHAFRLIHPSRGVLAGVSTEQRSSLWYRSRYLAMALVIGGLGAMIVLALVGYYYSSLQLAYRAFQSLSVLLAVGLVSAMLRRWLFLRRRRLALKQYRDRLEAMKARSETSRGASEGLALELPTETELDLAVLDQQTRQLIHFAVVLAASVGLLATWFDMLPALGMFGKIRVWSVVRGDEVVEVNVARVAFAGLAFLVMFVAVRNVPAVLEFTVLSHLPLDSGSRFAITTITRYVILMIGLIVGLTYLEIEWSQYGWLVAAATVGLGFGLQEIFANFISGLIVLLERPCRVGDVVTVDGVTGVVTRIQMRATTVTNFDQQELIVPNKEFVTGKLLNWTLSSSVNRVVITIGVAYGSDVEQVTQLLGDAARANPNVMKDPAPSVTFEKFGASSLEFTLRFHLPSLDLRLSTLHDVNTTIDRRCREAGIEIAFPQQDLHLRSIDRRIVEALGRGQATGEPAGLAPTAAEMPESPTDDSDSAAREG